MPFYFMHCCPLAQISLFVELPTFPDPSPPLFKVTSFVTCTYLLFCFWPLGFSFLFINPFPVYVLLLIIALCLEVLSHPLNIYLNSIHSLKCNLVLNIYLEAFMYSLPFWIIRYFPSLFNVMSFIHLYSCLGMSPKTIWFIIQCFQ